MSNKTKWNWIAQDKNGGIFKYKNKPDIYPSYFWPSNDVNDYELVQCGIEERKEEYLISLDTHNYKMVDIFIKRNWKESLINLETHDYKIMDGILIKVDKQDKQQDSQETIADKAEKIVFGDREQTYGDPGKNLRMIAGMWSAYLGIGITPEQVCDMMVQLKIARLKSSPDHEDSKVDIIGYTLLKERLKENEKKL